MPFVLQGLAGLPSSDLATRIFVCVAAAVFGAAAGSFLNVCVWRLPRDGLGIGTPKRSFCPLCGTGIAWFDNLPIVSWFALGGRCRSCRAPIAMRYPLVEALTAAIFALVAERYLCDLEGSVLGLVVLLALVSMLVVGVLVDIDLRQLPDEVTVGGMHALPLAMVLLPELRIGPIENSVGGLLAGLAALGERWTSSLLPQAFRGDRATTALVAAAALAFFVLGCVVYRRYRRWRWPDEECRFLDVSLAGVLTAASSALVLTVVLRPERALAPAAYSLAACLLGMFAGSTLVFAVGVVATKVFRKPAMGFGDVKLMGLLGGLTGWSGAIVGFLGACFLGAIWGTGRLILTRDRYLPFGPFLTIGCLVVYLWPGLLPGVLDWYLGLFVAAF